MSIKKACESYWSKEQKKYERGGKKNEKPEEAVVEKHLEFAVQNDWFLARFESKNVRHYIDGKPIWRQTSVIVGHPDLAGVSAQGHPVYIETKAPGRRSTVRVAQHSFLIEVIKRGGFGVVSDSLEYTVSAYNHYLGLSQLERAEYLMVELPTPSALRKKSDVGACPF